MGAARREGWARDSEGRAAAHLLLLLAQTGVVEYSSYERRRPEAGECRVERERVAWRTAAGNPGEEANQ